MQTPGKKYDEYIQKLSENMGLDPKEVKKLKIVEEYRNWVTKELADYDYKGEEKLLKTI